MKTIIFFFLIQLCFFAKAQYPPAAGQAGTTAIAYDSICFVDWASSCTVWRGFINISDTTLSDLGSHHASYGLDNDATGQADNVVVSLGDSGYADLVFSVPLADGPGFDFAVFENSFTDTFLELAFVEVSSDGIHFFRIPSFSLSDTTTQTASFGNTDPVKIHNLAGKYRQLFGTPFDLSELPDDPNLRKDSVTTIRVVDVIGSIDSQFAQRDSEGRKINDPFPTAFASGGFDLDAVGVIHNRSNTSLQTHSSSPFCWPNPVSEVLYWNSPEPMMLLAADGRIIYISSENEYFNVSGLDAGLYILISSETGASTKIMVLH